MAEQISEHLIIGDGFRKGPAQTCGVFVQVRSLFVSAVCVRPISWPQLQALCVPATNRCCIMDVQPDRLRCSHSAPRRASRVSISIALVLLESKGSEANSVFLVKTSGRRMPQWMHAALFSIRRKKRNKFIFLRTLTTLKSDPALFKDYIFYPNV